MTKIINTKRQEIESEEKTKKDFALELLNRAGKNISEAKKIESLFILVKTDGQYLRYSTGTDNIMEDVGQLELLKFDILKRMTQD